MKKENKQLILILSIPLITIVYAMICVHFKLSDKLYEDIFYVLLVLNLMDLVLFIIKTKNKTNERN